MNHTFAPFSTGPKDALFNKILSTRNSTVDWIMSASMEGGLLLVVIRFTCHVHGARDLCETRIDTIDTALENKKNNQSSTNQHRIRIAIQ